MSNSYPPVPPTGVGPTSTGYETSAPPPANGTPSSGVGSGGADGDKKEQVKEQASHLAEGAKDATQQVAGTAKEEVGKVAGEVKTQARDLLKQTSSELKEQAGAQQQRVAAGLHSVSDELTSMANNSEGGGVAADLVQQVASRAAGIASWLEDRDPGTLLDDVRDFARRKPGTFIGLAAVTGILVGRLTRSLVSANDDDDADASAGTTRATTGPSFTAPTGSTAPAPPTVTGDGTGGVYGVGGQSGAPFGSDPLRGETTGGGAHVGTDPLTTDPFRGGEQRP